MSKKELILKDKNIKLKVFTNYLEFTKNEISFIISYKFISHIYLINLAKVPLSDILKLAQKVPLYFIDSNGYILSKIDVDV